MTLFTFPDLKNIRRFATLLLFFLVAGLPMASQLHLRRLFSEPKAVQHLTQSWIQRCKALSELLDALKNQPQSQETLERAEVVKRLRRLDGAVCAYQDGQARAWSHADVPPLQPVRSGEVAYVAYGNRHWLAMAQGAWVGFLRLGFGPEAEEDSLPAVSTRPGEILFFRSTGPGRHVFEWEDRPVFWFKWTGPSAPYQIPDRLLGVWWLAVFLLILQMPLPWATLIWAGAFLIFFLKADVFLFHISPTKSRFAGPAVVALGPILASAAALWASALLALAAVLRLAVFPIPAKNLRKKNSARRILRIRNNLLMWLWLPAGAFLLNLFGDTMQNSSVSLNPSELPAWNGDSCLLFGCLMGHLFAWLILAQTGSRLMRRAWKGRRWRVLVWAAASLLMALVLWPGKPVLLAVALGIFLVVTHSDKRPGTPALSWVARVFWVALAFGFQLMDTRQQQVREFLRIQAPEILTEVDPEVQFLFEELQKEINPAGALVSLRETHLALRRLKAAHKQRFAIRSSVFDPQLKTPLLYDESELGDYEYFSNRIALSGHETSTPGLYRISRPGSGTFYVGKIHQKSAVHPRLVMVEIVPRSTALFFPGAAPKAGTQNVAHAHRIPYSYAIFQDSLIVESGGEFDYYGRFPRESLNTCPQTCFFRASGFVHYVYQAGTGGTAVVSVPQENVLATFSYFSLIFLCVLAFQGLRSTVDIVQSEGFRALIFNFRFRVRLAIIALLTFVFVFSISGTLYFLDLRFEENNKSLLQEKVAAVLIDLEENVEGKIKDPTREKQFLDFELTRVSELIFSDINFFNEKGKLISTSNPGLVEEGLVMPLLPPRVIQALRNSGSGVVVLPERTMDRQFFSGYGAVVDVNNHRLGYVQVPFIGRQEQYDRELSATLNTLLNAYVAALALLLTLSIFLINNATEPLVKISQRLRQLRYGGATEALQYPGRDEIGRLVKEYNRLAAELEKSAAELARRERESAWKDVARQVAHEIKNPLTPMKLGVQYLEKAWKEDRTHFGERLAAFKEILISQIEALDRIATEFSDYARIGAPQPEAVAVEPLLEAACGLFAQSRGNVTIRASVETSGLQVRADREQSLRILNNLIKNAVQAIPEGRPGEVTVRAEKIGDRVRIWVTDNGVGIPLDEQKKIFTPYFTTKSGGTGIGLSLCKNLAEVNGGRIGFQSEPGKGSTFWVELPSVS
ncbi:MAG: HAMP domain-containing histidine kinase [Flavobacteriales bacterium]|nr:HAMP domain-containing histidine kinase [Flavobacteriales bacterium]